MRPHAPPTTAAAGRSIRATVLVALTLYAVLSSLSVVWLADWGRHGPPFARHYGVQQLITIAAVSLVGLLVWLIRDRVTFWSVRGLSRWYALPAGRRWMLGTALGLSLVLAIGALHWAHKLDRLPWVPGAVRPLLGHVSRLLIASGLLPIRPSVTVELLRLPACGFVAWALYRWQHAGLSLPSNLLLALSILVALVIGLLACEDKGPVLVLAFALVLLGAAAAARLLPARWNSPGMRWLVSVVAAAAGVAALLVALPHLTPPDRLMAWRDHYGSRLEYLAQITWFLQASAQGRFGIGSTPWCGHLGALTEHCDGMPTETQSDFTLAALGGLWGPVAAWGIAATVAVWLLALIRLAAAPSPSRNGIDAGGLAASVGGLYALLLLAQLFVTALGNFGLLPLTGVTTPLLSWGRASTAGAVIAMALVMPKPDRTLGARPALASLWSAVLSVACTAAFVALVFLAIGLWGRLHDPAPRVLASGRSNPWVPLAGCVRSADGIPLQGVTSRGAAGQALCGATIEGQMPDAPEDNGVRTTLRQAAESTPASRRILHDGLSIPQRDDVITTLHATLQARADALATCLTGHRTPACDALVPASLAAQYARRLEGAAVRSVSLATLRQRDGALLATSHARSPCSAAQMANSPRPPDCAPEAQRRLARPGRLEQQALRGDDMVASTIKVLLADALLHMPGGERWLVGPSRELLLEALATSDTAFFIDELLCFGNVGHPATCTGPQTLARRVAELGLADPLPLMGPDAHRARLAGLPVALPAWPPHGATAQIELAAAARCHAQPKKRRWRGCSGEQLAALVAPLWGQGGARSHPLAIAQLYLRLAAAARGEASYQPPHLLATSTAQAGPLPSGFQRDHAALILEGLTRVPLVGTGRGACVSVFGPHGCQGMGLAMKTGTSLFPQAGWTVTERAARCRTVYAYQDQRRAASQPVPADLVKDSLQCALYPMKWAVLLEPGQPSAEALVTVVLVERNWSATTGHLDAADDRAPNAAMEAALLLRADQTVRQAAPRP